LARTLYLHVGPAKTGTSAIQDVLRRHDNSVVIYPKIGLWKDGSHHNLVFNFFQKYTRARVMREDAGLLFAKIGEEARQSQRNLAISSEALAGQRNLDDFVGALQRHLGPEPFRVELIVVVREHFEHAASTYNQRVKDGETCELRDPDQFLVEKIGRLGYARLLRRLAKTGFDIAVLNYHPPGNCAARVLEHIGFAPHQIWDVPILNPSLSQKALIAVLAANRVAPTRQDRKAIVSALLKMPGFYGPSQPVFSREAVAKAEPYIALDRVFLETQYGETFRAPDSVRAENPFVVNRQEFADIANATSKLANLGVAVREEVGRYLRHSPAAIVEKPAR
jgi:hypothetical protein